MRDSSSRYRTFARPVVDGLKQKSVRGGAVAVGAQGAKIVLQTATMMLLARLLSAEDFGLQGMVLVLTVFLGFFREAGLGQATVQRPEVTHEQISTLFWINVVVGVTLATATAVLAPVLVGFYGESRLYWMAVISGVAFIFNGLTTQHQALILREMRFVTLAKIDLLSLTISSAVGVVMALFGWGYWSLVGIPVVASIVSAAGAWLAVPWVPGPPRRKCGVISMLHFGWMSICTSLLVFLALNTDAILIGRVWGADALGVYGRAYQLAMMPINQLITAIGGVAFSAFSRIQDDPDRLIGSFLRAYSLIISLTVPIVISCPLFAEEIISVVLGAKWMEAAPIFRLLAPTALVFAFAHPLSWFSLSAGRVGRVFSISATTAPVVIAGVVLGLSYGPKGVALGTSVAMVLMVIPIVAWTKHGTPITWADFWRATKPPLLAGLLAGVIGLIVKFTLGGMLAPIPHLLVGLGFIFTVYAWVLIAMGQKSLYADLLTQLLPRARSDNNGA
jgi:O-antigen/teichoic acid export membrane protein